VSSGVVIAGGGLAAQRCAETLRSRGYEGRIRIACAEPTPPYDRPPLSKEPPRSDEHARALGLRDERWYADNEVELLLRAVAVRLLAGDRELELEDGTTLAYEELLVATGAAPRRLPGLDRFENAFSLRTIPDSRRLGELLDASADLVVVGAGFIGLEVAATARAHGAQVTVVEPLELPLEPILGPAVGRRLAEFHAGHGVRLCLGSVVAETWGNGAVESLELSTGERLTCDAAIVGVGVTPAAAWLAGSGLETDGVLTDASGRTRLPHVYAAGDVARPFDPGLGTHVRTEHWDAASRQGVAAARAMLGGPPPKPAIPSFWSDQYGLRIHYVGHAAGADQVELGDGDGGRFWALYRRGGRAVAALAADMPRELARLRRQVELETFQRHRPEEVSDDVPADNR
jgi:NADPH-dependent 2,4-dienoyl-CoA reductase/sulfur reductase-like enzyme